MINANKSMEIERATIVANVRPYPHRGTLASRGKKIQDIDTIESWLKVIKSL